jgi:hypothetical protein
MGSIRESALEAAYFTLNHVTTLADIGQHPPVSATRRHFALDGAKFLLRYRRHHF